MTMHRARYVAFVTVLLSTACSKANDSASRAADTSLAGKDAATLEAACLENDMQSCNDLARKLAEGPMDESYTAQDSMIVLFVRACTGGYKAACNNLNTLARTYMSFDTVRAAMVYKKACDAGDTTACAARRP